MQLIYLKVYIILKYYCRHIFISFILIYILLSSPAYTQYYSEDYCASGNYNVNNNEKSLTGGWYKPSCNAPGEFMRALIIFVQFSQDTVFSRNWPLNHLPDWAYHLVDSVPASTYRPVTLSDYFKKMSYGRFDFIGDVYPDLIVLPYYICYEDANIAVINYLSARRFGFRKYDNWKFQNGTFIFSENNGDGYADMIIVIYRHTNSSFGISGGAPLLGGFSYLNTYDGTKIGGSFCNILASGITTQAKAECNKDEKFFVYHLAHEYGHYLFGSSHTRTSGLMCGSPYSYDGSGYAMNSWERSFLGYETLSPVIFDGSVKTLRDYVTTGDALKIQLRNPNEYLIIENHQRKTFYDQIIRGGNNNGCWNYSEAGKGIYIWYVKGSTNAKPDIYAITADGNWSWKFGGYIHMPSGWPDSLLLIDRDRTKRALGEGLGDRNSNLFLYQSKYYDRWHDRNLITNEWVLSREVMGDETDAFNLNGNSFLTPWTNPGTRPARDNSSFLSIQIISQNGDNIDVKITTSESAALTLPPSPPQNLMISIGSGEHPVLSWEANTEPDMKQGGKYKIFKTLVLEDPGSEQLVATINNDSTRDIQSFTDTGTDFHNSAQCFYRVTALDVTYLESRSSDTVGIIVNNNGVRSENMISQKIDNEMSLINYPNPFNSVTSIFYSMPERNKVLLKVFDLLGRKIATLVNEEKERGEYTIQFNAKGLTSGVYLFQLQVGNRVKSKKFILLK